jgi:hypothetical protein
MRDKILKYANSQGLSINETGGGVYYISFNAKPNFKVTITVPFFVLEWSISIRTEDDNNEIFSESCEHNYGDKGETKFDEEMEEAVINTIKALNNADIRITKTLSVLLNDRKCFNIHFNICKMAKVVINVSQLGLTLGYWHLKKGC